MDIFCKKCGARLTENGTCPNCSSEQDKAKAEEAACGIKEEGKSEAMPKSVNPEQTLDKSVSFQTEGNPDQPETKAGIPQSETPKTQSAKQTVNAINTVNIPQTDVRKIQPSRFYFAFRQIGNVLKHFFSKHTIDAISAQYNEVLPIWVILLPVCAIISALSMTLSFDGTRGLSIGAGSLFSGMKLSGLEVFLISLAMSTALEFIYSIAVMIFFRTLKIKAKFKAAANLTMSSYIAVALFDLLNIITIGTFKSENTSLSGFGTIAFTLLLFFGITNVLKDKKPFWSFFLMITCASLTAVLAALVVSCPIIVMRGLEQLANTTSLF